jgi:uncharacterized protein
VLLQLLPLGQHPGSNPGTSTILIIDHKLVYDARILAEYRDVLCRPRLKLNPVHVFHFLEALGGQMSVVPERLVAIGPDPDDMPFVEVALAVPDRTIVTGNLAAFPSKILNGARIFTPDQALAELSR